jgi:hypothetical protein
MPFLGCRTLDILGSLGDVAIHIISTQRCEWLGLNSVLGTDRNAGWVGRWSLFSDLIRRFKDCSNNIDRREKAASRVSISLLCIVYKFLEHQRKLFA